MNFHCQSFKRIWITERKRGFQSFHLWPSSVDLFPKARLWSVMSVWLMNAGVLERLNLPLSTAAAPGSPIEAIYAQKTHFHLSLENIFPLFFTRYTYTFPPHLLVHRKPLNPPKSITNKVLLFNRANEILHNSFYSYSYFSRFSFYYYYQIVTNSSDAIA